MINGGFRYYIIKERKMAYQNVFKRYELKYLISNRQREYIIEAARPYMKLDSYGRTLIRNIYFDTDSYRLIRRSIEKPIYKEKLRVRSYGTATFDSNVFVELKKKYDGIVYKRRISLPYNAAMAWLNGEIPCPRETQISREIDYFKSFYSPLYPMFHISYEREAYFEIGGELRVTFDDSILACDDGLTLCDAPDGFDVIDGDCSIMEIKCSGGIPSWMMSILSDGKIYKTTFSKYGAAYTRMLARKKELMCEILV